MRTTKSRVISASNVRSGLKLNITHEEVDEEVDDERLEDEGGKEEENRLSVSLQVGGCPRRPCR